MLMTIASEMRSLQAVAAYLPFNIDDVDQANASFGRWRREGSDEAKQIVDIWTYCYVKRYFLIKFSREANAQVSDLDALVHEAFTRIESRSDTVTYVERYASWVSVVCKHTFINFLRQKRSTVPLHETTVSRLASGEHHYQDGELVLMNHALRAAVSRLPSFLQDVARLRFIERRSYEEIGDAIGRPLPIVRTYVSKAVARFRSDPHLMAVREEVYEYEV